MKIPMLLAAVGLVHVSARPVPAGGFYPAPNYPPGGTWGCTPGYPGCPIGGGSPYPGGSWGCTPGYPGCTVSSNPYPGLPSNFPSPPKPGSQMCNCNNPTTRESLVVEPFCRQAGGQDQYRGNENVESVTQHTCVLVGGSDVYSTANCQKEFGPGFKGFCAKL